MNKEETKKIIGGIMASFPNWKPANVPLVVETWASMLGEFEYEQVAVALKSYIFSDTSGFAPSIGQLVDMMQKINSPQYPEELEAWSMVSKALRNGAYHSREEFENLPPIVQKTLGSPQNLHAMAVDESFSESVAQSNFIRNYRTVVQRDKEFKRLPREAQQLIATTSQLLIGGN